MAIEDINKLKQLDLSKQLTFAYLTCERLYPNYVYFSNNFDFGNKDMIREAIDFLYLNIFQPNPDRCRITALIKGVKQNTPDTEDFTTIFVSSALDACTCTSDSLSFLLDKDFSKIEYISSYGFDTVDMYIRDIENDDSPLLNLRDHTLMKRETLIQKGIVSFLLNTTTINYDDVETLLKLQENNKKSNLDL